MPLGQIQNNQTSCHQIREPINNDSNRDAKGESSERVCSFYWKGRVSDKENVQREPEVNRPSSLKRARDGSDFFAESNNKVRKVASVEPMPRRESSHTRMADQGVQANNSTLEPVEGDVLLSDSDDESTGMFSQVVRKRLTDADAYLAPSGLLNHSSWIPMNGNYKFYLAAVLEQWKISAQHASQVPETNVRNLALLEDYVINVNSNINQLDDMEQNGAFVFALSDRNDRSPLAFVFVEPNGNRADIRFIQYNPAQVDDAVTFLKDQLAPVLFMTLRSLLFHEIETTAYSEELTSLYSELDFDIVEH